jgi:DNA excision repair protein ERCC-1
MEPPIEHQHGLSSTKLHLSQANPDAGCLVTAASMDEARPRAAASASTKTTAVTAGQGQPSRSDALPNANPDAPRGVQQPKPQALPSRSGPSSILVSPRQKGNPILNSVQKVAWEYSDIPADYVLGATTCALFLSLKYHRLHPEYVYNRIRDLKGQYQLRILLTMVDIENHEESLRELSKTSLVNNVTIILAWSAQEAGRYLELFKTYEHAGATSIKTQKSNKYSDSLVDFITVPRGINKTDAVGLVSNFGRIRTAVNATPEEIGLIGGWGEKKVQRWCNAVREPFRLQKAAKRVTNRENTQAAPQPENEGQLYNEEAFQESLHRVEDAVPIAAEMSRSTISSAMADPDKRPPHRIAEEVDDDVQKESSAATASSSKRKQDDEAMNEGIMAALSKLRKQ